MKTRLAVLLITFALTVTFALYSLVYFHYHVSAYAEGCPEQATLLWCK